MLQLRNSSGRPLVLAACMFVSSLYSVAGAHAQGNDPNTIREKGTLDAQSQRLLDGRYFDAMALDVEPGFHYVFTMRSRDVDSFLWLQNPKKDVSLQNAFAHDDDSGGGLDAQIAARFSKPGRILIIATTYKPGEQGQFELIVTRTPIGDAAPGKNVTPAPKMSEKSKSAPPAKSANPAKNAPNASELVKLKNELVELEAKNDELGRLAKEHEQLAREAVSGVMQSYHRGFAIGCYQQINENIGRIYNLRTRINQLESALRR